VAHHTRVNALVFPRGRVGVSLETQREE
jgi:hypothetical protein